MRQNLQEAFEALRLVEDTFSLNDTDSTKDILDFKSDYDISDDFVSVIDANAEDDEHLKDSYIGDVVVECQICHSPIFKCVDEIEIDEESQLVNIADECPVCHSNDGFTIIGQIAPFPNNLSIEIEDKECDDDESEDSEIDYDDEDLEESCGRKKKVSETYCKKCGKDVDRPCITDDELAEGYNAYDDYEGDYSDPLEADDNFDLDKIASEDEKAYDALRASKSYKAGLAKLERDRNRPSSRYGSRSYKITEGRKASTYDLVTKELYSAPTGEHGGVDNNGHKIAATQSERYDSDQVVPIDTGVRVVASTPDELEFAKKVADYFGVPATAVKTLNAGNALKVGKYCVDITIDDLESEEELNIKAKKEQEREKKRNAKKAAKAAKANEALSEDYTDDDYEIVDPLTESSYEDSEKVILYVDRSGSMQSSGAVDMISRKINEIKNKYKDVVIRYVAEKVTANPFYFGGQIDTNALLKDMHNYLDCRKILITNDDTVYDMDELEAAGLEFIIFEFDGKIQEGFEKVDLELEDKIIHVSEEEKPEVQDEMIVPVSDALENELTAEEPVEQPIEEPDFGEEPVDIPVEEPAKDATADGAPEDEIDFDIEDFDEDEFDGLGESYMKKVYENVNSFRTTSVSQENNKLIIEGLITFKSGKSKVTSFVFEATDATKSGKVRFKGLNEGLAKGYSKAFTLSGRITEGKFISESLNYNYKVNKERIYGTEKK